MRPPHATGVVEMGERAFDPLAALSHQSTPACPANASTIAIDGSLCLRLVRPVTSPAIRLGDVGANAHGVKVHHRLIAVIPLVSDDLFQLLRLVDIRLRVCDLLRRSRRGVADGRGVAFIGTLY